MQEANAASIEYFRDFRRVADLLNGVVFHGKQVIQVSDLEEKNPVIHSVSKRDGAVHAVENTVDLSVTVTIEKMKFLLMLQAQTKEHYAMPVRVLHERGTDYYNQWKTIRRIHKEVKDLKNGEELLSGMKKNDTFYPVLHVVVYFGRKKWTAARSMDELISKSAFPEELQKLFEGEKPVLVFEIRHFQNTELFQTDLRQVCEFLQRTEDKTKLEEYVSKNKNIFAQLPEDTYDLLTVMGGIKQMELVKNDVKTEEGGFDMSKAFDDMLADRENEGIRKGIRKGEIYMEKLIQKLLPVGRYEDLMLASTDRRYRKELMKELGIS